MGDEICDILCSVKTLPDGSFFLTWLAINIKVYRDSNRPTGIVLALVAFCDPN
jgi:hypothetical protein